MASITARSHVSLVRATRPARATARRTVLVSAKYGEGSKFFDLKDMENTTGAWDMYGQDDKKRYPGLQETFFVRATDILTKREALRGFVALFGIAAIAAFGLKGAADANLPITKAPTRTENGMGGSVRSRL